MNEQERIIDLYESLIESSKELQHTLEDLLE